MAFVFDTPIVNEGYIYDSPTAFNTDENGGITPIPFVTVSKDITFQWQINVLPTVMSPYRTMGIKATNRTMLIRRTL